MITTRARRWKQAVLLGLLSCLASTAGALDMIAISATKKTVDQVKGSEQDLPRGKSRATERLVMYRIDVRRMSPQVPENVVVEWMILVEAAAGRVLPGTMGSKTVQLPLGQSVSVDTDTVRLLGREWRGGPVPGTVQDEIAGYGIRVLGPVGNVLAEKYDPSSAKNRVDWKLLRAPAPAVLPRPGARFKGPPATEVPGPLAPTVAE